MATHSSILAWIISWTEEPCGLQSTGSQRVGHDWVTNTYLLLLTSWLLNPITFFQFLSSMSSVYSQTSLSTSSSLNARLCWIAFFDFSFLSQPQKFAVLGIPSLTLAPSHIVCPPWVIPFTASVSTITQMLITSYLLIYLSGLPGWC